MEDQPRLQTARRAPAKRASEVRRFFDPRAFVPERINAQITKRYSIDAREVGSGGYGKVFIAEDKEVPGRKVAVKKILVNSKETRTSFEKEVRLMKELDHPNICKILETYENGRIVWVVMELCEGGEVFDRIMERGEIEERTAASIVKQVAKALKYAHGRGIAHRDLKPENVCFCDSDRANDHVKVIDWGVGFHFNSQGMSSAVGSTTYAAPEVLQANGTSGYTSACDLWSLGVMTYVMLRGKPPFWGALQEQLRRMMNELYPMHGESWQAVSHEAKDFIRGLLKVDPQQRLTLDAVLAHPWLGIGSPVTSAATEQADGRRVQQVLSNCRQFSKCDHFFSICAASVAKQLDHRSLQDVHKVFTEMDTNGDGVLELREVVSGFEQMFGKGSEQARGVEEIFGRLDLDGSGKIDYTEFCAAGLGVGERVSGAGALNELSLRAAFKAFDVNDDNGRITRDEIQRVLASADVGKTWSKEVCEQVTEEIFERYDGDKDGSIDFEEWLTLMRDSRYRRSGTSNSLGEESVEGNPCMKSKTEQLHSEAGGAPASDAQAVAYGRTSTGGLTLLERRPLRNRFPSLGGTFKETGRSKRILSKVSGILSMKKGEAKGSSSAREGEGKTVISL